MVTDPKKNVILFGAAVELSYEAVEVSRGDPGTGTAISRVAARSA